jgi:hypothetical protein
MKTYLYSIEWRNRLVEIFASLLTIMGVAVGSTTPTGNDFYMAGQVFWWWLTISRRMWGLLPLNIAMTCIELWHYFHQT